MKGIAATLGLMVLVYGGFCYQHSLAFVRGAPEDRYGLWLAALKGFKGTPRYVGSLGQVSYFLVGDLVCSRFKAPTSKLHLPSTFPLGEGKPYRIDAEMVPSYP